MPPAHHVVIEARDADHANEIALLNGIYFDGCESGNDCSCCGDRWSPLWKDDGTITPLIYNDHPVAEFCDNWPMNDFPNVLVIYLDGRKKKFSNLVKR